jgi:hypothetical protein
MTLKTDAEQSRSVPCYWGVYRTPASRGAYPPTGGVIPPYGLSTPPWGGSAILAGTSGPPGGGPPATNDTP